jgi:hypothetical protein
MGHAARARREDGEIAAAIRLELELRFNALDNACSTMSLSASRR